MVAEVISDYSTECGLNFPGNGSPWSVKQDLSQKIKNRVCTVIDEEISSSIVFEASSGTEGDLRNLARRIYLARQARNRLLSPELVGEPAWDILLDLYARDTGVSVKHIALSSDTPQATASRWIALLEGRGFISKRVSSSDARRAEIFMTEYGRERVAVVLQGMKLGELIQHP